MGWRTYFSINPAKAKDWNLLIRIPGWAQNEAVPSDLYSFQNKSALKPTIKVNGKEIIYSIKDGYAVLNKIWKKGDKVEVLLPMETRRVIANSNIKEDDGKVALQRGPVMYCAEWVDNAGKVSNLILPSTTSLVAEFDKNILNGVTVLKGKVPVYIIQNNQQISTVEQNLQPYPITVGPTGARVK